MAKILSNGPLNFTATFASGSVITLTPTATGPAMTFRIKTKPAALVISNWAGQRPGELPAMWDLRLRTFIGEAESAKELAAAIQASEKPLETLLTERLA
jgi:hypothetical protein